MSAYITLSTPMTEQQCLLDALEELGFPPEHIEVHAEPQSLVGYEGRQRGQKSHIIIRKKHVGTISNDIGFLNTTTGYRAFVSDFDEHRFGSNWLEKLQTTYNHHYQILQDRLEEEERLRLEEERRQLVESQRQTILAKAKRMGYRVQEQRDGEKVRLVLLKRVY